MHACWPPWRDGYRAHGLASRGAKRTCVLACLLARGWSWNGFRMLHRRRVHRAIPIVVTLASSSTWFACARSSPSVSDDITEPFETSRRSSIPVADAPSLSVGDRIVRTAIGCTAYVGSSSPRALDGCPGTMPTPGTLERREDGSCWFRSEANCPTGPTAHTCNPPAPRRVECP